MTLHLYESFPVIKSDDASEPVDYKDMQYKVPLEWAGIEEIDNYANDPDAANMHLFAGNDRRFYGLGTEDRDGKLLRTLWQLGNGPEGPGKRRIASVPDELFEERIEDLKDLSKAIPTWEMSAMYDPTYSDYRDKYFDAFEEGEGDTKTTNYRMKAPYLGVMLRRPIMSAGFDYSTFRNQHPESYIEEFQNKFGTSANQKSLIDLPTSELMKLHQQ